MGNKEHMKIIQNCTVEEWNRWRADNTRIQPDLTRIDLSDRDLTGIDFRGVGLFKANFQNAVLRNSIMRQSIAIKADFRGSDLTGAFVYGISAWDVETNEKTVQKDLIITEPKEAIITVDNLQLAQFLHLLLNNKNIRDIIQVMSNKAVLILGRFAYDHLAVLQAIRESLRKYNYLPILFDFEKPNNRDLTETIITLASLSKYVICDLSHPTSIPQEMQATIPHFKSVIFQPIIQKGEREYSMFEGFQRYDWVRPIIEYSTIDDLMESLKKELQ